MYHIKAKSFRLRIFTGCIDLRNFLRIRSADPRGKATLDGCMGVWVCVCVCVYGCVSVYVCMSDCHYYSNVKEAKMKDINEGFIAT